MIRKLELEKLEIQTRLDLALHATRHDSLTGLPNRAGFLGELASRIAAGFQTQTVFLLNIDRFKLVNETLGHDAGDDLIRKIGVALGAVVPGGGLLARLGGDEFGVVTETLSEQGIGDFCKLLLRICAQSRRVYGHEVQVSACIGVCIQGPDQDHSDLLRQADLALRAAKREGRNRYRLHDEEIASTSSRRLSLEAGLDRALGAVRGEPGRAMARETKRVGGLLKARTWMLATAGALMPFVGLFGTVIGVMASFQAIGESGQGGFAVVSVGISQALVATAVAGASLASLSSAAVAVACAAASAAACAAVSTPSMPACCGAGAVGAAAAAARRAGS
jgi:diguanylate cyclase (GGDEF)-like protein